MNSNALKTLILLTSLAPLPALAFGITAPPATERALAPANMNWQQSLSVSDNALAPRRENDAVVSLTGRTGEVNASLNTSDASLPSPVPLPAAWLLLLSALAGTGYFIRNTADKPRRK